jgi:hypothetical protein
VIPPELVVGAAVGRPQVEALERGRVWRRAKRDADKATGAGVAAGGRLPREIDLSDRAVGEVQSPSAAPAPSPL